MHLKKLTRLVNFCVAILILEMKENEQHFRHMMLYYFKKGRAATETREKIWAVRGESAGTERTCQVRFEKFRAGDLSPGGGCSTGRKAS